MREERREIATTDCVWKAVSKEAYKGWHDALCTLSTWNGEVHALCEIDL